MHSISLPFQWAIKIGNGMNAISFTKHHCCLNLFATSYQVNRHKFDNNPMAKKAKNYNCIELSAISNFKFITSLWTPSEKQIYWGSGINQEVLSTLCIVSRHCVCYVKPLILSGSCLLKWGWSRQWWGERDSVWKLYSTPFLPIWIIQLITAMPNDTDWWVSARKMY